jgi:hypothetical protein
MKLFFCLVLWLIVLFVWPVLAIAALILFPVVWLLAVPLRLFGMIINATLELLRALLLLPARFLGGRPMA